MRHKIRTAFATVATLALAVGASACHPARLGQGRPRDDRPMSVNARLDCPEREGDLARVEQAPDGRSCRYTNDDGEEVVLGFLALDGRPAAAALAPTEATLRGLVPAAVSGSAENAKAEAAAKAKDDSDEDDDDDDKTSNATSGNHDHGHVAINLPGVHVEADDAGARVHAFGQDVIASDDGANVRSGWNGATSEMHANDGGVEMRSGWIGAHALDQSYMLASAIGGPGGEHAAGYIVRGPVTGPLVIAVIKARSGGRDVDGDRFDAAKRLVRRNTRFD